IISEVLPNPAGADKDGEWIELANLSGKKINLRGWILEAKTKTGAKRYIFSGDNFIEPNRHLLVKRSQSNLVLANTGGEVNLLLPPDKNLSKVSYGEAKEGKSYALINNNWQWTGIPTPGKENIPEVADPLRLSEASKTAKSAAEGKNIVAAATDSSNIILPESGTIADEEFSSAPNSGGKNQAQNNIIQLVAFSDLEKYLGKAIGDKISDAVSSLVIKPAEPNEKISAPRPSESLLDAQSAFAAAGNAAPAQQQNSRQNIRNNPWFYSSLILSGLSLFLVWRYQELRKRIK
ncbi:lamin tail domain-containing protein, partial [Patescibacteria group bacterium]|nr:lamin tail domain-containing protein [Patescibacteria group bacterium]